MRFSTALALSAVPAVVFAANQTVTVGDGGQLAFNPSSITAQVGDTINFEFRAKNHSVTQSTFAAPCAKAMFNGSAGVSSGFIAIPQNSTSQAGQFPTWSITLKDTKPLWFHCGQTMPVSHCQMGMVFSINPSADKTADAYLAAAKASTANSTDPSAGAAAPGGAAPSGAAPVGGASAPSSGATPSGSAGASSGASPSDSAAASSATGSGVAAAGAAAGTAGSSNVAATSAADQSAPTSGASTTVLKRGAAGLFTVAAAVCVVLL